jgi:hypothetical protein
MGRASGMYGKMKGAYTVLVRKPGGKRPLVRPRRKCKNNIKMDLQDAGWEGIVWTDLAQNRSRWWALENAVKYLRVP